MTVPLELDAPDRGVYDPVMSSRGSAMEGPLPYDDEFLFHLSRGSEFLVANRVDEAKEELERALVVQPRDAKGQDLLAGVYFRLGVYPRAIELWSVLVEHHPEDVALHVNLGLALLKTAQLEAAVTHLSRATALDPAHARAWGYLGLALWREGRLDRARDAFARGGQESMARRMEEMLGITASAPHSPSLSVMPPPADTQESARRGSVPPVPWVRPAGEPGSIDLTVLERGDRVSEPPRARTALDRWLSRAPVGSSFASSDAGLLVVAPREAPVMVVRERVLALRGERASVARGPHIAIAPGEEACLGAPEGHIVVMLTAEAAELLYVVERHLLAYEGECEVRTVEAGRVSLRVASIRGPASLAISCPRRPVALSSAGEPLGVSAARLVGWSGRLFPGPGGDGDALVLTGEGTVLAS